MPIDMEVQEINIQVLKGWIDSHQKDYADFKKGIGPDGVSFSVMGDVLQELYLSTTKELKQLFVVLFFGGQEDAEKVSSLLTEISGGSMPEMKDDRYLRVNLQNGECFVLEPDEVKPQKHVITIGRKELVETLNNLPDWMFADGKTQDAIELHEHQIYFAALCLPVVLYQMSLRASQENDSKAYCVCYFFVEESGLTDILRTTLKNIHKHGQSEVMSAVKGFMPAILSNSFMNGPDESEIPNTALQSLQQGAKNSGIMNLLAIKRWVYEHSDSYADFVAEFDRAEDGDYTFLQKNMVMVFECLSNDGVKDLFLELNQYVGMEDKSRENMRFSDYLDKMMTSEDMGNKIATLYNMGDVRVRNFLYWILFDDGVLKLTEFLGNAMSQNNSSKGEQMLVNESIRANILNSLEQCGYSKQMWREAAANLSPGITKGVFQTTISEAKGKNGRRRSILLLEEIIREDFVDKIIPVIASFLNDNRKSEGNDMILVSVLLALENTDTFYDGVLYPTFHHAMIEKFPEFDINAGYRKAQDRYNECKGKSVEFLISYKKKYPSENVNARLKILKRAEYLAGVISRLS